MPLDKKSTTRRILSFIGLIIFGVEALIRGPQMMPDTVAYILGVFAVVLAVAGIISTLNARDEKTEKTWAGFIRRK
jgi:uncharacterized membrane protein HdeD (DUF308 family)